MTRARKQVTRSFSACWTCRRRRVKCNGVGVPCNPCRKHRIECEGYGIELVWVDPKTGAYPPFCRRAMDFEHTWRGRPVLNEERLQRLIDEVDDIDKASSEPSPSSSPFTVFTACRSGMRAEPADSTTDTSPSSSRVMESLPSFSPPARISSSPLNEDFNFVARSLTPTIMDCLSASRDEAMIFYHYVTWIAPLMIPVDGAENPWKSVYPSTALRDSSAASRALYHAILAQSAFNIANLHRDNRASSRHKESVALRHYGASLRELSQSLSATKEEEYDACAATLYTLMISEGNARGSVAWRDHFDGVGGFVTQFVQQRPWTRSAQSWVISQSLALSFEISQTGNAKVYGRSPITDILLDGVASREGFGYTIGASCDVLRTISSIRLLAEKMALGDIPDDLGTSIQAYLVDLSARNHSELGVDLDILDRDIFLESLPEKELLRFLDSLHLRLFRTAALIYLHQAVLNVPPRGVRSLVRSVLADAMTFMHRRGGSISLWPVFIAATEATEREDQVIIEQWLTISSQIGMRNRLVAGKLIHQIWQERSQEAIARGINPDLVIKDWKAVQQRLGVDLLLL
ncbi:fungal-specific transcription factor domain-containing protein [Trichoderma novae-zelandiae]